MKAEQIRNCVWANEEKTRITCEVKFEEFQDFVPFTASYNDVQDYGVSIFNTIVSEGYEIGEYRPLVLPNPTTPPQPTVQQLQDEIKTLSDKLSDLLKQVENMSNKL